MLRYQAVKYFVAVARHGSVTKAAQALYLSQSGLSVHIRNLEQELGVTLLERTNRNVRLTPAGEALYRWAAPFFDGEDEAVRCVRQAAMGGHERIVVGTVAANITYSLSDMIQRFHRQYGDIQVSVRRMNMDPLYDALRGSTVDLAFQFLTQEADPGYAYHVIERGKLVLAVHKSSPLAAKQAISYGDLRDAPIACLTASSAAHPRELLLRKCAAQGFKPNIVAEFEYVEPLLTMVNMGSCVTITSDLAPLSGLENVCYVELEDAMGIDLAVIWRRDARNPAAQLFIRHVIEMTQKG